MSKKGARKSSGGTGQHNNKNSAMARLRGVKRGTLRCPVCNRIVGMDSYPTHLLTCRPPCR